MSKNYAIISVNVTAKFNILYGDYYKYELEPLYSPLAIIFNAICNENIIVLTNLVISNTE